MKFYDASKPLNVKTDAFSISLGAGLLQVWNGVNCEQDRVPDNTPLHPNAFTSKSLSSI